MWWHRLRRALASSCLIAALAAGCGPVTYINQVTRRASADVEEARAARAQVFALFWYTLAVEYLRKAREEAAEAHFQAASRLGEKASEAAQKAVEEALSSSGRRGTSAIEESPGEGAR